MSFKTRTKYFILENIAWPSVKVCVQFCFLILLHHLQKLYAMIASISLIMSGSPETAFRDNFGLFMDSVWRQFWQPSRQMSETVVQEGNRQPSTFMCIRITDSEKRDTHEGNWLWIEEDVAGKVNRIIITMDERGQQKPPMRRLMYK